MYTYHRFKRIVCIYRNVHLEASMTNIEFESNDNDEDVLQKKKKKLY